MTRDLEEHPAASGALRWWLTAQALSGTAVLLIMILGSIRLLFLAIDWTDGVLWLVPRALLALAAGLIAVRVSRWLWVRLPAPDGIPLKETDAPELHTLLKELRSRFLIKRPVTVRITGDMNASVVSRLRGLTLQVGLPLLLGVTPRQCCAILSHEFGHLVLQRAGPGSWASHLHSWWYRVLDRIDQDETVLGRFMAWALGAADRRYLADGMRLSRAEEFQADALAAETVGSRPLAEALSAIALKQQFLAHDFLPKIHEQVYHRRRPVILPYRHMASAFLVGYDSNESLATYADVVDEEAPTHPSIRARMARFYDGSWPTPGNGTSAAEAYLGNAVPWLANALDQAWWQEHGHDWTRHHREVQWAQRRIAMLAERGRDLHPLRRLELANLVESYWPEWNPLELYSDLLNEKTVHAQAMLALGRLLMVQDSAEGAGCLLAILDEDNEVGLAAAIRLLDYAEEADRQDLARRAKARVDDLQQWALAIEQETEIDPDGEAWVSPGLDAITRYKLAKAVTRHASVRRAYLVRRLSKIAPKWQAYLLLVRTDTTDPKVLAEIREEAQSLLRERALLSLLQIPARSPYETAAAATGRTRLHVRRKPGQI
jgi:Zn-dependent protease with chaperone function